MTSAEFQTQLETSRAKYAEVQAELTKATGERAAIAAELGRAEDVTRIAELRARDSELSGDVLATQNREKHLRALFCELEQGRRDALASEKQAELDGMQAEVTAKNEAARQAADVAREANGIFGNLCEIRNIASQDANMFHAERNRQQWLDAFLAGPPSLKETSAVTNEDFEELARARAISHRAQERREAEAAERRGGPDAQTRAHYGYDKPLVTIEDWEVRI